MLAQKREDAMEQGTRGSTEVVAQLRTESALTQIVEYRFQEPPEARIRPQDSFRIDLCLTARHRGSRASFPDLWPARRFEPIGEVFVAAPNTELIAKSEEDGPLTSVLCALSQDVVLSLFEHEPGPTDPLLLESLDVRRPEIRRIMLLLAEEARHPGLASELMAELFAQQLAIEMVRHGAMIVDRCSCGGLAPWQLRLIDERVKEVGQPPSLADLADLCRVSVRQLARGFRASRGCSLGAYVADRQVEHAKILLAAGESVGAIATTLGFASTSNFCFAFRRETGNTPGQFRRKLLLH
jgi:AraC family transcriptional regulator